jgi:O-antigen ligase
LYGVNSAHNTWLQIAVDNGIPAAVILAFFIAFVLKDAFRLYSSLQDKMFKKYVLLFLAGLCSTIITSPFVATIWPVFTERQYSEASQLAPYLISFWLSYGIILGIEKLSLSHESLR